MSSDRREFVGQLAALAVGGPFILRSVSDEGSLSRRSAPQGVGSFVAIVPQEDELASPWDMSWLEQLAPAKHKAVFDTTMITNGLALGHVQLYLSDYHDIYGTDDQQVKPVLVIRHEAVPMILNDAFWQKYQLGQKLRLTDPATGATTARNPFAAPGGKGTAPAAETPTLQQLRSRGVIVIGCNKALMSVASLMAQQAGQPVEAVQAEAKAAVLPGVILSPSGIFAVMRAQEAGCQYIRST